MTATIIAAGAGGSVVYDGFGALTDFTITLASLASSTTGVGQQSTLITNTIGEREVKIYLKIKAGTAPTSGRGFYVFLLTGDGSGAYRTDGAGASNAGLTMLNAPLIGVARLKASGAATGDVIYKEIVTRICSAEWGIAVYHDFGSALDSTGGNHLAKYQYITPTVA